MQVAESGEARYLRAARELQAMHWARNAAQNVGARGAGAAAGPVIRHVRIPTFGRPAQRMNPGIIRPAAPQMPRQPGGAIQPRMAAPPQAKRKLAPTYERWGKEAKVLQDVGRAWIRNHKAEAKIPGGQSEDKAKIKDREATVAAAKLVPLLPPYAMAKMLNVPVADIETRAEGTMADIIASLAGSFSGGHIDKGRNCLIDLIEYAISVDREVDQTIMGEPSNALLASYLKHVGRRAREKKARSNAARGRNVHEVDPRLREEETERFQDGSSAAPGRLAQLRWLANNLGFNFDVESICVRGAVHQQPRKADEPAPPIPIGVVIRLHEIVSDECERTIVRLQAAMWLAIIYSSSRLEQAQLTDLQVEDAEAASGVTVAKSARCKPRNCLVTIPKEGIIPHDGWFATFKKGIPAGATFMLCDVEVSDMRAVT